MPDIAPPPGIPVSDHDPYAIETILDPYAMHEDLRGQGPIVWLRRYNCCAVARYASAVAVLTNSVDFLSSGGVGLSDIRKPDAWRVPGPLVESDPPQHTAIRRPMNRIFAPQAARDLRWAVTEIAEDACDRAVRAGAFDAVRDLIAPYGIAVLSHLIGTDLDLESTLIVGDHSFNAAGPRNALFHASAARAEKVALWYEQKQTREAMKPGGFGAQVFEAEGRGDLPAGTATGIVRTLIRGGMDTTASGLATALHLLARHPDIWEGMADAPALAAMTFEEAVRLESPTQTIYRTTARDLSFFGVDVPGDVKVQILIGAANRDPAAWEAPGEFRPGERKTPRTLAFGTGHHNCLGQAVARLEAEVLLTTLRRKAPRLRLDGPVAYRAVNALRALGTLPLRVDDPTETRITA